MCTRASVVCVEEDPKALLEIEIEDNCPEQQGVMNVITNATAIITTPEYPAAYPVDVDECWSRVPSCGHTVQLEFTEFNVRYPTYICNTHA